MTGIGKPNAGELAGPSIASWVGCHSELSSLEVYAYELKVLAGLQLRLLVVDDPS